jgi:hypothetical protein
MYVDTIIGPFEAAIGDCEFGGARACPTRSTAMDKFIHDENLRLFRKRLAETADEKQRQVLQDLIAKHEAKYREWQLGPRPN